MRDSFTVIWSELIDIVSKSWLTPLKTFILRYTLQTTMYTIWWERNARRYGEKPRDENTLARLVDKNIRLKLLSLQGRGDHYEKGLITWFDAQLNVNHLPGS